MLSGNIGYADLGRLPANQVNSMFKWLKDARAIIFDMRGYPFLTAWSMRPTIAGVRAGRHEVLDGAMRYLERSLPKTSTR